MKFSTIISRTVFAVSLAFAGTFVAVAPAQAAAPMQHKQVAGFTNPPGTAWMQIVKKKGTSDFATSFTADASLQTSALSKAVVGPTLIGAFFAATSKMYEHIEFTAETVDGAKTYLEWEGIYGGKRAVLRITSDEKNPGGPYQWCLRAFTTSQAAQRNLGDGRYGFIGASFPGRTAAVDRYTLEPGKPWTVKFRVRLTDLP